MRCNWMLSTMSRSPFLQAIEYDDSLPIEKEALKLWMKDLDNPFRWSLRPFFQFLFAILLHLTWFIKRLPLPQFSAHNFLQKTICWFCENFVSVEANVLILRHYSCESNIINFLIDNQYLDGEELPVDPIKLYPKKIGDMMEDSFVKHDQELFRCFKEMGHWQYKKNSEENVSWQHWQTVDIESLEINKKKTQVFDFETSHALFMCLFCLLLTREEYRDAINGFNLDQSMAIRVGEIIEDKSLVEMAYNKFPHYLVGPWNLSQRFLMHGFFCEYVYSVLHNLKEKSV